MSTTPWVKARKSGGNGGNCVELRRDGDAIELRDSKHGETGPILRFTPAELDAFLDGARNGEFDHLL
ncbi:DUF397 domain-containing protein [Longispora sp. K20-0274]|uniref:DUF397 domain-containing protein n=1 Tax=Longispora sp. K20-0274 TaxID=3088255 RepID=UPI00399B6969